MHQRNRTWMIGSDPVERVRQRTMAIEGGDGSTLNLDFTSGVLDPRFTFTRGTNATFVNSSGYVQYALANMQPNTNFDGIGGTTYQLPWGGFLGTGATFERLSSGVLKCKAATSGSVSNSNRAFLSTTATIPIGLPITLKVTIQDKVVSSTLDLVNFLSFTVATTSYTQYRVNGVARDTSFNSVVSGDVITLTVLPTSANGAFRVGLGCNVNQSLNDYVTIANVMLEQGEELNATYRYLPNSSTTVGNFDTPRFNYSSATIGQAQGLLFEGTTINYTTYSQDFTNAIWLLDNSTSFNPVVTTENVVSPGNNLTVNKIVFNKTGGAYSRIRQTFTGGVALNPYTMSVWMKTVSGTANVGIRLGLAAGDAGFNCAVTTTWTRFSYTQTITTADATPQIMLWNSIAGNDITATVYVWGCQVEAGSGASSYIPTGASQGTRNHDLCVMNDITTFDYSTSTGTISWRGIISKQPTGYTTLIGFMTAGDVPTYETFGNALSYYTAARGSTLTGGGSNEVSRSYTLNTLIRYASSVNTLANPIVAVNLNGSAGSTNKAGTGNMFVATRFVIGRGGGGYATTYPSVTIQQIRYYPTAFTAAQLQALTAP